MRCITPEAIGVSSAAIQQYIAYLEENAIPTHDMLLMRGDEVFFAGYWKPFHANFQHRMYSVSKSVVALAVGFAEQDGLVDLDKPIVNYFPEESAAQTDVYMRRQTVRDMLMMSTAKQDRYWFTDKPADRVKYYFENPSTDSRPAGVFFRYDSTGSFVLGALVERLTGMPFLDYLRVKFLDEIGVSENIYCLKCPGGHSWGDSAIICTPLDMLKIARFTLNGGAWNGKQLLNRAFVEAAVAKQLDNQYGDDPAFSTAGYGYQIWRTLDNSFFFNGMGSQLAICVPEKDMIMMYNADTQSRDPAARQLIVDGFFRMIVRPAVDVLPEDAVAHKALCDYAATLELLSVKGEALSPMAAQIDGVSYALRPNKMGMTTLRFDFDKDGGVLTYINAQGEKQLPFGLCRNVFSAFPQDGYPDDVGTVPGNRRFACATSAAWVDAHKLHLKVQVIDTCFGTLDMVFGFKENTCSVVMRKAAEDFFGEYDGEAVGYAE